MGKKITSQAIQTISKRIRQERKQQGLTQTELAGLCGVSLNFISQLEQAKETVRLDKLVLVLITLGLELKIQYGKKGVS